VSAFDLLHPALQYHVVNTLGWARLRPVQLSTIEAVLQRENVVVLAPTAGGKTEAAFLPLLSLTLTEDWQGLSVLYVSPIKALLNNQHERLERYYRMVGRRAEVWHGDVSPALKRRLATEPPDCLLTTPESLEVMLVSGGVRHERLFAGVRALVVDEAHAFASDDRGWHLLAVLQRVRRLAGRDIQRLGLSATVGNPQDLLRWLSAGSGRPGRVISPTESGGPGSSPSVEVQLDFVGGTENAASVIAALHQGEKRLIFCDSRSRVEQLGSLLRARGIETFVSHSSLSLDERRQAERAFAQGHDCVIVATSALELGIDVGDLDRVIQIDAPPTVSSFLQRMGRTGRRPGARRNCLFLATTDEGLLRAAGLIRLWAAGHVEPAAAPPRPLHILAQQLMALALQEGGVGRHEWFSWVDAVPAFRDLTPGEVEAQVSWMLEQDMLWDDSGVLWLGRRGQDDYGRKNFLELFSVFISPPEFAVLYGRQELGSVHEVTFAARQNDAPVVLLLAGRSWRLRHLDWKRRQAFVEPNDQEGRSRWWGQGQVLSHALCQAIRAILAGKEEEPNWSRRAKRQMAEVRLDYKWASVEHSSLVLNPRRDWLWWTFAGGKANAGLAHGLSERLNRRASSDNFAVRVQGELTADDVEAGIRSLRASPPDEIVAAVDERALEGLKFAECLPPGLASAILQARLADASGVADILGKPVRITFDN
jgi:ATP-dependent Lhr-like helicase